MNEQIATAPGVYLLTKAAAKMQHKWSVPAEYEASFSPEVEISGVRMLDDWIRISARARIGASMTLVAGYKAVIADDGVATMYSVSFLGEN